MDIIVHMVLMFAVGFIFGYQFQTLRILRSRNKRR